MQKTLFALAGVLIGVSASAVTLPGPAFPQVKTPEALKAACDRGLAASQVRLGQLERLPADKRWLAAYDAFNAFTEDAAVPLLFISAVHPDKAMRDASEACELRWNDFSSSLGQNEKLYKAAKKFKPADAIDAELRRTTLEGFEDAGVALPVEQRARAKALIDKINELGQAFDRNIRDANIQLAFTEAELHGVPEAVLKRAKRDDNGRLLLGVDYPSYDPVMQAAEDGAARERMWRAKTNEGGEPNLKLLAEITRLRREYAALFGVKSFAEFQLRRRMAQTPERAQRFLDDVKGAVEAREKRELEELRVAKAAHLKQPLDSVRLERWDATFYRERVRRERYAVDQEAFRPYFPPEQSLQFALRVIERVMGVKYQRVDDVKAWHSEVQGYAVLDAKSGRPLATLYIDLYPREGKYNHAAVWPLRHGSTLTKQAPQSALVANLDRKGLTLDELETLLHELGHSVHGGLSNTRYTQQSGTQVMRDFVEAPSQMLEEWVHDKRVLKLFAEVCPSCQPVPEALLEQALVARHYGQGMFAARQHLYASYDLSMYLREPHDPLAQWAAMEGATPLGYVKGTMFPASFSHIATNYGAGYYGYLWSKVVALDMATAWGADMLDAKVGARYRNEVLARGSERLPGELVKSFLGREFNAKAFYEELAK
ncbi:MAG: Zn-dependent oligopeptidase [Burkholderiales bacterium]|nr:Zn-dependent oligopeptidase [Burkholderiales bacterium]